MLPEMMFPSNSCIQGHPLFIQIHSFYTVTYNVRCCKIAGGQINFDHDAIYQNTTNVKL